MDSNPYQKVCPECGETFIASRLNRIYCPSNCKTQHNNKKARARRQSFQEWLGNLQAIEKITKKQNQILWKNREILRYFVDQEVTVNTLKEQGFQLRQVTRFSKNKINGEEKNILYVYDFCYYFLNDQTIKIFKA